MGKNSLSVPSFPAAKTMRQSKDIVANRIAALKVAKPASPGATCQLALITLARCWGCNRLDAACTMAMAALAALGGTPGSKNCTGSRLMFQAMGLAEATPIKLSG